MIALFTSVSNKWLFRLETTNNISNKLTSAHDLLQLIFIAFKTIPSKAIYVVCVVLMLNILTTATNNKSESIVIFIPFLNFLKAAIQPFISRYYAENQGMTSSLFTQLEMQLQSMLTLKKVSLASANEQFLKLSPYINKNLELVPTLSPDDKVTTKALNEVTDFVYSNSEQMVNFIKS